MSQLSEFEIIRRYFSRHCQALPGRATGGADLDPAVGINGSRSVSLQHASPVLYGVGDDAAVVAAADPAEVDVLSVDNMVQGQHFFADIAAADLAHKALATALSDLAAMAATAHSVLLSLTLPKKNLTHTWLQSFSDAFYALADRHAVRLIGGNTSAGAEINLGVTVWGRAPATQICYRDAAQVGDLIYVIGHLGAAAAGMACYQGDLALPHKAQQQAIQAWLRPQPLLQFAPILQRYARAAIDVSDGLLADLQHILTASGGLGATVASDKLPQCAALRAGLNDLQRRTFALCGGEDYALCITLDAAKEAEFLAAVATLRQSDPSTLAIPVSAIGRVQAQGPLQVHDQNGVCIQVEGTGWQHF